MFSQFVKNLAVQNYETISLRYGEITTVLNKQFRDTESKTANSLQVGSFGRATAINGISDLDMLYIMPKSSWEKYNGENGTSNILNDTRSAILDRYPRTEVKVDRLVVTVTYNDFYMEIQPVFEQDDESYKYPDTYQQCWKVTKPREEIDAIIDIDNNKNGNVRNLCKMVRAWKNKHGIEISGLLIDTLVYNFFEQTTEYDDKSFIYYDWISRDFFKFLSEEPEQNFYQALGSNQQVKVKQKFQRKAKGAYQLCLDAIDAEKTNGVNDKWKELYGRPFPSADLSKVSEKFDNNTQQFDNTEEFIEDQYPIDIRYSLKIDCEVSQDKFREHSLRDMILKRIPLLAKKNLRFFITNNTVPYPYQIKWKVLNRGIEAERRNQIRGQVFNDAGQNERIEKTSFKGAHIVECYVIKNGIVVARDNILVPIATNG